MLCVCVCVFAAKWACCHCFRGLLMHSFRAQLEPAALIRLSFWATRSANSVSPSSVYATNWDITHTHFKSKISWILFVLFRYFLTVLLKLVTSQAVHKSAIWQSLKSYVFGTSTARGNKSAIYMLKWLYDVAGTAEFRRKARRKVQKKPQKHKHRVEQKLNKESEFLLIWGRD